MSARYPEIDIARTIAIAGMIVYHTAFDLMAFYGWSINLDALSWVIFQRTVASLFLGLVGISFAISWDRAKRKENFPYRKYFSRAMFILAGGFLVSLATYVADPTTFVRFGVLHLIGVSILILPFVTWLEEWNGLLGLLFVTVKLPPPSFASVDYFPIFPWFGVVLIGYAIGRMLYVRGLLTWHAPDSPQMRRLTWPGRHSLWIYLLHQPVILALLWLLLRK